MAPERVVVVVQARMGSRRFPGKSLAPFGDSTLVQHVVRRLLRMETARELVVATTELAADDALVQACEVEGASVFRGSEEDVLARFVGAVDACAGDLVLRICADRPFVDPALADELVRTYPDAGRPDYLSNTLEQSYPVGLDLELVRADALREAAREAVDPYEREHVTPFVYRRPERFGLVGRTCPFGNYAHVRAVIDERRDYDALRQVERRLVALRPRADWRDLLTLAELEPELFP